MESFTLVRMIVSDRSVYSVRTDRTVLHPSLDVTDAKAVFWPPQKPSNVATGITHLRKTG
jgi:hypothetical protein